MRKTIICISILISILIIIGIAIPFIVHSNSPNVTSEITADGTIEYIIGYLSFITTGALAVYAIFQTKQANDMTNRANDIAKQANDMTKQANDIAKQANNMAKQANDMTNQLLEIEKNNYRMQICPFISITKYDIAKYTLTEILNNKKKWFVEVGKWDSHSDINGISLTITNTTESFLTFQFNLIEDIDSNIEWKCCTTGKKNIQNTKISLLPGESKDIVLLAEDEVLLKANGKSINLNFILENRFANKYKETIKMIFISITKDRDNMTGFFSFQDIHIYKFEYKEGKDIPVEIDYNK